ncbi:MAG: peptide chain release factor 1 [bacterium]
MFENLEALISKYNELTNLLSDPKIIANQSKYQQYAKSHAELYDLVVAYQKYKKILKGIGEAKNILNGDEDQEFKELAQEEYNGFLKEKEIQEESLKILLLPSDPNDKKNILLEIRAGTGGDEAGLFVADLFRMYSKYAEKKAWRIDVLSSHSTGVGGLKEIIVSIQGESVYSRLKYESGVHRVQRVPTTEASGRIHTSTITVAVLPEADDVEVQIDPSDLRIDIFRSSGPGGQSVNTTDSAVRVTHIPTGLVVSCQDEKSQHKNKAKAVRILKVRLYDKAREEQEQDIVQARRLQIGSGDRSEKIRTYNFPQGRISDHRINLTLYKLDRILEGSLDEVIDPLIAYYQAEALNDGETIEAKKRSRS